MNESEMMVVNWADIIILTIVIISLVVSIIRGMVKEAITLITWCLGGWLAYEYGAFVGQSFTFIQTELIRSIAGGGVVFFAALITGGIASMIISKLVKFSGAGFLDRIAGALFGALRGTVIVIVAVTFLMSTPYVEQSWWTSSQLIPKFQTISIKIDKQIPEQWKADIQTFLGTLTL